MAITYQSLQTGSADGGSVTITKPTSLAEGDLMIAGIVTELGTSGTVTLITPSGWTVCGEDVDVGADVELGLFYKIATAGDVAASNFTFTSTGHGSSGQTLGAIVRATAPGILAGYDAFAESNSSTTLTIAGGFTPTRADTLFLAFVSKSSTIATGGFTSVALTTNNPTWTERADFEYGRAAGSYDTRLAVYTATRAETTATGDITVTNTATDSARYLGAVVAFSAQVNGSLTNEETKVNAYAFNPIQSIQIDANVENPITATSGSPTRWTNPDKPSTSWTNQPKI